MISVEKFQGEGYPITKELIEFISNYKLPKLNAFYAAPNASSYQEKKHNFFKLDLFDEPSDVMNSEEKGDLIFWIKDIQEELGVTILIIEHDMKMVMDISNRILAVNFGKTIIEGKPEEVATHPEVLKAYLSEDEDKKN